MRPGVVRLGSRDLGDELKLNEPLGMQGNFLHCVKYFWPVKVEQQDSGARIRVARIRLASLKPASRYMPLSPYQQLEQEFRRLHAFRSAASMLRWDSAVMMPKGSSDLRGEQLAALETESHSLVASPRVSRLLDRAEANAQGLEALADCKPARDAA